MQRLLTIDAALMTLTALLTVNAARADVTVTRDLMDSVPVERGKTLRVVVDDINGFVHVVAHDGRTVDMRATETITGRTQGDVDRARQEVALRTERSDGQVAFLERRVDSSGQPCDCPWRRHAGYSVAYEIEIAAPRDTVIDLATVNGEIEVDGMHGDFAVSSVNGAIRLDGLQGSGNVSTVNGRLAATFEKQPAVASSFKTVNGRIDVAFPRDLSADLKFKTLHGDVYTDFEAVAVSQTATADQRRKDGFTVIRSERHPTVRVGKGGPTHSFETVNGEVYVREARR